MTAAAPTSASPETLRLPPAPPEGLAAQLRVTSAMAIAGLIFWSIGWLAWQPADPRGPVLLYGLSHQIMTFAVMAVLSVVAAGLAVIVAGFSPDLIAPAAVAVGLASLDLRGARSDLIGDYIAPRINGVPIWPATGLIVELWLWLGLIVLGGAAGRWVAERVLPPVPPDAEATPSAAEPMKMLAVVIVSAPLAYALIAILNGSATDGVFRQQIYFAVGLGLLLATLAGQFVFRSHAACWPLMTVGLVGAAAYIFGQPHGGAMNVRLAFRILPNVVARPLPIEFAAMGAIGGLLGLHFAGPVTPSAEKKPGE